MRSFLAVLLLSSPAVAGVIAFRPLPAEWRGFLSDLRTLRNAANPAPGPNPLRDTLTDRAAALETRAKTAPLSADDAADLGECFVRLGQPLKAVAVLRAARQADPKHHRLAVELGVAWAAAGDWDRAATAFDDAVSVAPAEWKSVDVAHRRLARNRAREGKSADGLDDLFGVTFVGEAGKPEAGKLADRERKKLPADAVAVVQRLLVRSPADARLLWQLGELANAAGDVRTAANILDGCVGDFALKSPDARARRTLYRAAADAREKAGEHALRPAGPVFQSPRLFAKLTDEARLPKVDPAGVNRLPWAALGDTRVGRQFRPTFLKYVADLDGKTVELIGFMQPFAGGAADEFVLTEFPVGCWYCDQPWPLQVAVIALGGDSRTEYVPGAVVVVGKLMLNRTDPERHLFAVTGARVARPK